MTRDGFSTAWTSCPGRASRATLLALAIASGCGARTATPTPTADTARAPAAPLDEAGCLALLVSEPAARVRCERDARGPCVSEIKLAQVHASPARHVCFVLTTSEHWEAREGEEEALIHIEGSYTLAVLEEAAGTWAVRDRKEYLHWRQEIEVEDASLAIETIGPGQTAAVVSQRSGHGAYSNTKVMFHLVTSDGLTESFSFLSDVDDDGRKERSYRIDGTKTTAGLHDIVVLVEEESFLEEDDGEVTSWEERYRWNGEKYVLVAGKTGSD